MKDVLSNKVSKEEILSMLKCIRCGSIENLKPYKHKEKVASGYKRYGRSSTTEIMTWTQEFPVCTKCFKKFKKWNITSSIYKGILTLTFIPFWILVTIFLFFPKAFFGDAPDNLILIDTILFSPFICLLMIFGILFIKHKKSENKPSYFMRTKFGWPRIKPENSEKWYPFNQWAELILKERVLQGTIDPMLLIKKEIVKAPVSKFESDKTIKKDIKYCPKCGNVVILSKSHICEVCGYEFK